MIRAAVAGAGGRMGKAIIDVIGDTDGIVLAGPASAGDLIYVASEDKNLYALDAATGQKRWWFTAQTGIYTPPVLADGVVYACSRDGRVHALDADNGNQRWAFPRTE